MQYKKRKSEDETVDPDVFSEEELETRQDIIKRVSSVTCDDPNLTEVLDVFDPSELYLSISRRGNWHLRWNVNGNKYMDKSVWVLMNYEQGRMTGFVKDLFKHIGIEVRKY